jgi:hypothetical protein
MTRTRLMEHGPGIRVAPTIQLLKSVRRGLGVSWFLFYERPIKVTPGLEVVHGRAEGQVLASGAR